jgi:hypothetical protein
LPKTPGRVSFIPGSARKNGDRNLGLGCAFVGGNSSGMEKRNVYHCFFYLTGKIIYLYESVRFMRKIVFYQLKVFVIVRNIFGTSFP